MRFLVLNGVQVTSEGGGPAPLQPSQQAALFSLVVSRRPLTADQLRELWWAPDAQPRDRKRPIKIVSQLRRMLGERILSGPRGYGFRAGTGDVVDLYGWRAIVEEAERVAPGDPRTAAEMWTEALTRWVALPEAVLPDTEAMGDLVGALEPERLQCVERLAEV